MGWDEEVEWQQRTAFWGQILGKRQINNTKAVVNSASDVVSPHLLRETLSYRNNGIRLRIKEKEDDNTLWF